MPPRTDFVHLEMMILIRLSEYIHDRDGPWTTIRPLVHWNDYLGPASNSVPTSDGPRSKIGPLVHLKIIIWVHRPNPSMDGLTQNFRPSIFVHIDVWTVRLSVDERLLSCKPASEQKILSQKIFYAGSMTFGHLMPFKLKELTSNLFRTR